MSRLTKNETGMVLTIALLLGLAFSTIALAVAQFALAQYTSSHRSAVAGSAVALADAGGDNFLYNVNANSSYDGTDGSGTGAQTCSNPKVESTLFNNSIQGKGTFETCVQNGTISGEKIIYSTGRIYLPATAASPYITRKIKLVIEQSSSSGYPVQTGPAGLILGNNVKITAPNIYVGGFLQMTNNSQINGSVNVGNYQCPAANPPGSSYPTLCSGNGDPITISNGGAIYGSVYANGQTPGDSNSNRMSSPGLVATSGVANTSLPDPTTDRTSAKANIGSNTMTAANANSCSGSYKTWNNVHITGSVSLPNNCSITVTGDVWIDGSLTTGNNNTLSVGSALTSQPRIMIDGSGGLSFGNNAALASNAAGIGFKIITYWNADNNPDASSLTGNDLYSSIFISNNRSNPRYTIVTGNNTSLASGTTLYAAWSGVQVNNNGSIGSVLGQVIDLNNNGTITFNNANGVGGTTVWDVRYYEQL